MTKNVKLDTTALTDLNDEYNPQDILLSQTNDESDAPEEQNLLGIGSSLSL